MTDTPYAAIVLAGGQSRRMQVEDKTRVMVGGRTLLDRVLAAVAGAEQVVVVGEERRTDVPVRWTCEEPHGSGPAAALAAGLALVETDVVVVLAADLPFVTPQHVRLLVSAVTDDADGACYVDDTGREQWLCGAWRTAVLRETTPASDGSLRGTLSGLLVTRIRPAARGPQVWFDCDTPEDLQRAVEATTQ
jgi:molybdopterin-guanine dinucleotide biosynthesis protein A